MLGNKFIHVLGGKIEKNLKNSGLYVGANLKEVFLQSPQAHSFLMADPAVLPPKLENLLVLVWFGWPTNKFFVHPNFLQIHRIGVFY